MFALSQFSRRAATMAVSRRLPSMVPVAAFGTQAHMQVQVLEDTLKSMSWSDVRDNVKEISDLMKEAKTNRAVPQPEALFEGHVTESLEQIQTMLGNSPEKDEIAARVHDLKKEVQKKLYFE